MTRYLLDTHFIYWWMTGDRRLGKAARTLIAEADCTISVVSLWDAAQERQGQAPSSRGAAPRKPRSRIFIDIWGFRVLPIHARHVEATLQFGHMHDDPFDRLLAATAVSEDLVFLTRDEQIQRSGLPFVRTV